MPVLALITETGVELADPDTPHVKVTDLGLMRGDGIFETVLVVDRKPRELGPHLARLARSARMMDLPEPDRATWEQATATVVDNWTGSPEMALKLVYTRGPEGDPDERTTGFALGLDIAAPVIRARTEGVSVITLDRGIDPGLAQRAPWLLLGAKSLSYGINMAALREAARRGASDVVFTATDGSVLEGPTSNVVVAKGRTLYTTPPHIGILPGTTQAAVFRAAEKAGWTTKVEPLTVADLREADGLFLSSSVRKLTKVHTLDGEALPDSTALHAELTAAYEAEY
ncbi:aminodeoxychorismate lyase [Amycolatopsis suaedae]|uniref:Aminodeoxychorismate lyase n=1 Tax=Amycolatopsis suaedae TaxID=2510978 RepID=A0A4Q7JBT6_9PSEU|nr:aminodeoxychorismate lyase [Amycolatopsis suaedae]RZQ65310.1 aminodeoxychorismate lyase [Amycolatopsis suaedae]